MDSNSPEPTGHAADADASSYKKGMWAERLAAMYLSLKGFKILKKRYKTKHGEIDIIALQDGMLVLVEVKARKDIDIALESISRQAQRRIVNATLNFLAENPEYSDYVIRFDVIAVESPMKIVHVDNAFDASP